MVKVETDAGEVGTAWVYEEGWLITAAHVTKEYTTLRVHYRDEEGEEKSKVVSVAGIDRLRDVAALEIGGVDLPAITGRREVDVVDGGEGVMAVGYSSGPEVGWPSIRVGALTTVSVLPWLDDLRVFETDAAFDPGDSGGPIFDLQGNVIGIAQATAFRTGSGQRIQGRQMAVSVQEVEEVWEQLKDGEKLNQDSDYWFFRRSEED